MTTFSQPYAPDLISKNSAILKRGGWGNGTDAVCMMSAMVPGAQSDRDCVVAGWPKWLSILNHELFDANVGAACEDTAAFKFAEDIAKAVSVPFDTNRALTLFLIKRLDDGEHSALKTLRSLSPEPVEQISAVRNVVDLLRRKLAREDVEKALKTAARAADAAAYAARAVYAADAADAAAYAARAVYAADDAVRAADAAARAADAAAHAARAANAAAYATYAAAYAADDAVRAADAAVRAADAAARAADAAAYAARAVYAADDAARAADAAVRAADAAVRADLIEAITEAQLRYRSHD